MVIRRLCFFIFNYFIMHCIQFIIGEDAHIQSICAQYNEAKYCRLEQNFAAIPLIAPFLAEVEQLYAGTDLPDYGDLQLSPDFEYATPALFTFLCEQTVDNDLAYVETDYFGGAGQQSAALFRGIRVAAAYSDAKNPNINPINLVLKELNVVCTKTWDEFDSIGLGDYRSNKDLLRDNGYKA